METDESNISTTIIECDVGANGCTFRIMWFDSSHYYHRDNGPAIIYDDGSKEYWQHGLVTVSVDHRLYRLMGIKNGTKKVVSIALTNLRGYGAMAIWNIL